jgi:hypothetical protein
MRCVVVPFALALMPVSLAGAQSAQPLSLEVSGLYNGVFGNAFDDLKDGLGGEVQLRYTPGALSVGAGFQYTNHGLETRPESARLYGGFIEPRYRIYTGSNVVAPYLSARISVLKWTFSGADLSISSNLIQLNGGGGVLYRLGSRLNLDLGATYGFNRLGSGTLTSQNDGTDTPFQATTGSNIVIRVGFAVGLGG